MNSVKTATVTRQIGSLSMLSRRLFTLECIQEQLLLFWDPIYPRDNRPHLLASAAAEYLLSNKERVNLERGYYWADLPSATLLRAVEAEALASRAIASRNRPWSIDGGLSAEELLTALQPELAFRAVAAVTDFAEYVDVVACAERALYQAEKEAQVLVSQTAYNAFLRGPPGTKVFEDYEIIDRGTRVMKRRSVDAGELAYRQVTAKVHVWLLNKLDNYHNEDTRHEKRTH